MRCRLNRKIFLSEQNGYTIAVYTTKDSSVPQAARNKYLASQNLIGFSAVGYNLPLTDQIELEMEGEWVDSDHGLQYKVESFMEIVPRTKEGIIGYLSSGAIKGIKEKTAKAIYDKFGLQTLEVMEQTPEELLCIRGISERKLESIKESFSQNRVFRELMTFLAPYHISPKKANMILQTFHEDSIDIVRHRPYMLSVVNGFGFLTVDAIGRQNCSSLNDPMRISGCVSYVLHEAMNGGHLYLEQEILIKRCEEVLNEGFLQPVVSVQEISQVLYRLVLQKSIVIEDGCIYIARQYEEETQTAAMIARRLLYPDTPLNIEQELILAEKDLGITLSERQKEAVKMVFSNHISIITGGPGTGKTTVLKVILYIHDRKCKTPVQLMAPTGRAARRMAESTGQEDASTMHMALGLLGGTEEYKLDFEYLAGEFINVDEVSMVDMHLAYEFFQRLRQETRVVFLGDVNQLPSVGAGDVFRQLIACELIPVTVLDMVYRQGAQSNIPVNAQLIQDNRTNLYMGEDFVFIPCNGVEQAAEEVKRIYLDETSRYGMDQVQILTPFRKRSAAGVEELNRTLQDMVNPPVSGRKELTIGKDIFRIGDKILQNKNTESVSNGDMGRIQDFYEDEDGNVKVKILFTDNRQVEYESEQMEMVEHANAITIHKSQGSECPVVIIPWVKAFYVMLKRNILYTAITRAKVKVYLVGEWSAVCQAIHTDNSGTRKTMLGRRIIQFYQRYRDKKENEMEQLRLAV